MPSNGLGRVAMVPVAISFVTLIGVFEKTKFNDWFSCGKQERLLQAKSRGSGN